MKLLVVVMLISKLTGHSSWIEQPRYSQYETMEQCQFAAKKSYEEQQSVDKDFAYPVCWPVYAPE